MAASALFPTAVRTASFCATQHAPEPRPVLGDAGPPALVALLEEDRRMSSLNPRLIEDAESANHAGIENRKTLKTYAARLEHFDAYLVSVHDVAMTGATKTHVQQFMNHLRDKGGAAPDPSRARCDWCRDRNYPDGKEGTGWSAS